jgi:hypothetical protein
MTWAYPGKSEQRAFRSRFTTFVVDAQDKGWTVKGNLLHESATLVHEDGTELTSYWYRDRMCSGIITTSHGTRERLSADEVRAAVDGARCSCTDPQEVFGYLHITPSDECAFKHRDVRVDLETQAGWKRYDKAYEAYAFRRALKDAEELPERRSA